MWISTITKWIDTLSVTMVTCYALLLLENDLLISVLNRYKHLSCTQWNWQYHDLTQETVPATFCTGVVGIKVHQVQLAWRGIGSIPPYTQHYFVQEILLLYDKLQFLRGWGWCFPWEVIVFGLCWGLWDELFQPCGCGFYWSDQRIHT